MQSTFGVRLEHFANTIDIVDDDTFRHIIALVEEYLKDVLNIQVVRVMTEQSPASGGDLLVKFRLDMTSQYDAINLSDDASYQKGHMQFAYRQKQPLWIVSQVAHTTLDTPQIGYIDLWSGVANIPAYCTNTVANIKTSIIVPILNNEGRIYGVINYETSDYLELTEGARQELSRISRTISALYQLRKTRGVQAKNTKDVIADISTSLKKGVFPKLTKPKVFIASANKGCQDVIEVLMAVLAEFSDQVDVIHWKNMRASGNVNQQLVKEITSSQYGICYFSEPDDSNGKFHYKDNSNVVFEAGMFHGRVDSSGREVNCWLPLREKDSPHAPFDLAAERTVVIQRDEDGFLETDTLKSLLTSHLEALVTDKGE